MSLSVVRSTAPALAWGVRVTSTSWARGWTADLATERGGTVPWAAFAIAACVALLRCRPSRNLANRCFGGFFDGGFYWWAITSPKPIVPFQSIAGKRRNCMQITSRRSCPSSRSILLQGRVHAVAQQHQIHWVMQLLQPLLQVADQSGQYWPNQRVWQA